MAGKFVVEKAKGRKREWVAAATHSLIIQGKFLVGANQHGSRLGLNRLFCNCLNEVIVDFFE